MKRDNIILIHYKVLLIMAVILSSYIAIGLGVLLLVGGYISHRRESGYSQYLLAGGGILVGLGILGLLWFVMAFS